MNTTVPPPAEPTFERVPPQDVEAEKSVLGGMLLSKDAIGDVVEILESSDFYRPAHTTIFNAITALYGQGDPADPITIASELTKRAEIGRVGGPGYIHSLVQAVPTAANAEWYAEIVHEKAVLRRLVEAGTRITQMGYAADGEVDDIADAANSEVYAAVKVREKTPTVRVNERYGDYIDRLQDRQKNGTSMGVPTGLSDLDSLTNGLKPGQLVIIAGRPAMGKTTIALDMLRACAIKHQRPAALFSLEMSEDELLDKITSAEARVAAHHITTANLNDDDWLRIAKATPRITEAPLYIDDTANTTVMQIKAKCRRLKQREGLDLIVVDYLQLLSSGRKAESRQVEVSEMSRQLKLLAKELEVPVIVLAQLNRGPEQRTDRKPAVSDLRESGSLEQDADIVILLHREDAYEKESPRAGEVDVIVGKHRRGPTATITAAALLHYSMFADMAAEEAW